MSSEHIATLKACNAAMATHMIARYLRTDLKRFFDIERRDSAKLMTNCFSACVRTELTTLIASLLFFGSIGAVARLNLSTWILGGLIGRHGAMVSDIGNFYIALFISLLLSVFFSNPPSLSFGSIITQSACHQMHFPMFFSPQNIG